MRHILLSDGLKIRFPGRDAEFDEGFEVGIVAAMMSLGHPSVSRAVSAGTVDQIEAMAGKLGYHLAEREPNEDGLVEVTLRKGRARPKLRMIYSTAQPKLSLANG